MNKNKRILIAWSGGKDSAMALYQIQIANEYEISALLTTVTEDYERISMHGVRNNLLERQASSLGLPVEKIYIPKTTSNEEYEVKMRDTLRYYQTRGVSSVVFGDIFLEDLREYRERNLAKIGTQGLFPLWKRETTELARTFIELVFRSVITCVDSAVLGKEFVGREYNKQFLADLPSAVDPCGENGEFHSFVYGGPIFSERIPHRKGNVVFRDNRFYFCDVIPI